CGWLDAVSLNRAITLNGVSGICLTKLDILDAVEEIKICTEYEMDGVGLKLPPLGAEAFARCEPKYESIPGWQTSTEDVTQYDDLPENAKAYIARIEELLDVPVDIVSTGPERRQIIFRKSLF
ncbi:MAG: adenylosuccinate synthetase, partial [Pseudomonadota bacterium]